MRFIVFIVAVLMVCPLVGQSASDLQVKSDKIIEFSRSGRDKDAIAIYEALPADAELSLVVMRAAAGCYWREKQLDKSRALYRKILDRRPSLNRLSDKPVSVTADVKSSEPGGAQAAVRPARSADVEAELKQLRDANLRLVKEREELRRKADKRITVVTQAAKKSAEGADKLQSELDDVRRKREAAEKVSAQIQKSIESQSMELIGKITDLQKSLNQARKDVSGLDAVRKAEIAKLENALVEEKRLRAQISQDSGSKLAAMQARLKQSQVSTDKLKQALADTEIRLRDAKSESKKISQELDKRQKDADAKIASLKTALQGAIKKAELLEKNGQAEVAKLQKALKEEQQARDLLKQKAAEYVAEVEAANKVAKAEQTKLEKQLADEQAKAKSSEAKIAELARSLDEQQKAVDARLAEAKAKFAEQQKAADARVATLKESLKKAQADAETLKSGYQSEIDKLQKTLTSERKQRAELEKMSKEVQVSLEKDSAKLRDKITALQEELRLAEMEVEQSRLDAADRIKASEARAEQLKKKIAELESSTQSMDYELASLSKALEASRIENAELSAKRANEADITAGRMKAIENTVLKRALDEVDALEHEYMDLDAQASARQAELLERIELLEKSTVTSSQELEAARQQVKLEQALRKEIEAQSAKRDAMLLEANKLLAESTQKIAKHFDDFRSRVSAGKNSANLQHQAADLAPLIGRLEEATQKAAREVKGLNKQLAEERRKHTQAMQQSQEELVTLRRQVENLRAELKNAKSVRADHESKIVADLQQQLEALRKSGRDHESAIMEEAEKKMRDMEASHRARTTKLQQELALVRGELTEHQSRYAELLKKSQANEIRLKQRIKELEQAFALPSTGESESSEQAKTVIPEESAAVVPAADVKISARYQAIIDMTVRDKSRALKQYEKLPADTQKPIALLKAIANVYRDKKNYEKAYAMYEEVLQRNPGDLYAERKLVMTLFDLGRYDEALARLSGSSNGATGDVKRGDSQPEESQK